MVTKYGMSEDVGLICYDDEEEVFIGRDLGHTRGYSETVAARIDGEIKRIVDECYAKARQMIREHEDVLHRCAELLLEKEKINRDEFEALFVLFLTDTDFRLIIVKITITICQMHFNVLIFMAEHHQVHILV